MYYYIIDPTKLNQRQFERVQNQLYSSLSEYRISGETMRVTSLRTINQLVELAIGRGAKTIVAVGSSNTLHDVINAAKLRDVTIGFIPLIDSELGSILGLTSVNHACKTIAMRRIAQLDLGEVNNPFATQAGEQAGNFFLSKLSLGTNLATLHNQSSSIFNFSLINQLSNLPTFQIKFKSDNQYTATFEVIGAVIINSRAEIGKNLKVGDPTDGTFNFLLLPKLSKRNLIKYRKEILNQTFDQIPGHSLLHARHVEVIGPDGLSLSVGNKVIAKTPVNIEMRPRALRMIVGRGRNFGQE